MYFKPIIQKILLLLFIGLMGGCIDKDYDPPPPEPINPYIGYSSTLYDGPENWLCRPDIERENNVCERDISATIVFADGTTMHEENSIYEDQPVDCFYVYPTASLDTGDNADLNPDQEIEVTYNRVARYRRICKIYAPVYRQVTISALFAGKYEDSDIQSIAYGDVVDAFRHFIANGDGRGFILVSHSQGSTHLERLIQEEIEAHAYLAQRMISAHLIGWTIALPIDDDVGATFSSTPPCTFANEIGCFVNYESFRLSNPPADESLFVENTFGNTNSVDTRAACTNPADLGGGLLHLDSYFTLSQLGPYADPERNESIGTHFVKLPGLIQGECIEQGSKGYLAITVDADPFDPRVDDINNDLFPGWGLHLIDFALGQGDLVRLAERQADVWLNK